MSATNKPAQSIFGTVEFENGVLLQFHDDFNAPYGETRLEIIGDEGRIISEDCLSGRPAGTLIISDDKGKRKVEVNHFEPYAGVIQNFNHAVKYGVPVEVSGLDGAIALATALAAEQSAQTGKRINIESI